VVLRLSETEMFLPAQVLQPAEPAVADQHGVAHQLK
jgi:hypothetical protein